MVELSVTVLPFALLAVTAASVWLARKGPRYAFIDDYLLKTSLHQLRVNKMQEATYDVPIPYQEFYQQTGYKME